jgi:hypothetical protein
LVVSHALPTRIIREIGGTVWHVAETLGKDVPGAMAETCLIFNSPSICRRYWSYPADWSLCSDAQLLDFMNEPRIPAR